MMNFLGNIFTIKAIVINADVVVMMTPWVCYHSLVRSPSGVRLIALIVSASSHTRTCGRAISSSSQRRIPRLRSAVSSSLISSLVSYSSLRRILRRQRHKKWNLFIVHFLCFVLPISLVPVSCVSPDARGWSLYLTQLGGFVSRQRWFSWKSRKLGYFALHMPVLGSLRVRAMTNIKKIFFFLEKNISEKKNILRKKYSEKNTEKKYWRKSWKYFSKEKSTELSQVERSPTCIGADPGSCFTFRKKCKK